MFYTNARVPILPPIHLLGRHVKLVNIPPCRPFHILSNYLINSVLITHSDYTHVLLVLCSPPVNQLSNKLTNKSTELSTLCYLFIISVLQNAECKNGKQHYFIENKVVVKFVVTVYDKMTSFPCHSCNCSNCKWHLNSYCTAPHRALHSLV